jgi:hypothetical protein
MEANVLKGMGEIEITNDTIHNLHIEECANNEGPVCDISEMAVIADLTIWNLALENELMLDWTSCR